MNGQYQQSDDCTEQNRELVVAQFTRRESGIFHPTYDVELQFYEMVSDGRVEQLRAEYDERNIAREEHGTLSADALRNLRYHIIVTIAMISRFCIEKGLDERESYELSDYYIRRADEAGSDAALRALHRELVLDYAARMKRVSASGNDSPHCIRAMDYIENHLHEKIALADVADYVGLERTYLCRLFHTQLGCSMNTYILHEKLKVAKNMLEYSDFSCTEIAEYLAFGTDSYFARVFRRETGLTPTQYRKNNYRRHWNRQQNAQKREKT